MLDRKVGNYSLNRNCYIVCAGNSISDRAIVNNLGTAMQTRLIHLSLSVDFNDWLTTVAIPQDYDYRITSFLVQYPNLLNNFNPENTLLTYAVPRTWSFCNSLIKGKELEPIDSALLSGTIGTEVALQFIQYTKVYANLPSIDSIITDPVNAILPTDTASRWAVLSLLLENIDEKNVKPFVSYSERFGIDLRIFFLRSLAAKKPSLMANPALSATILSLGKYLHS